MTIVDEMDRLRGDRRPPSPDPRDDDFGGSFGLGGDISVH